MGRHVGDVALLLALLAASGSLARGDPGETTMQAAMATHRAVLDERRMGSASASALGPPQGADGRGRKRGFTSPRGASGSAHHDGGAGAGRGRHTRFPSPGHQTDHGWDEYSFRPSVPMHLRRWNARAAQRPPQHTASTPVLRIVSYNLLAESLESNTTAGLDPSIASFQARRQLLDYELQAWDADIYCLQEVDHFDDYFAPAMEARGFKGEFLQRRGDRQDGCAVFWRRDKLRRVSSTPLHFDVSAIFDRPNVAQILEFEALDGAAAGQVLVCLPVAYC